MSDSTEAATSAEVFVDGMYGTVVFPLRGERRASMNLPLNLTPAEAERIGRALVAWAIPDDAPTPGYAMEVSA